MNETGRPPQDIDALYDAARAATDASDHRRAIALCEEALALQPAHAGLLQLLGFWRLQQERWSDAIDLFHRARRIAGDKAELLNHLATAYYRSGDSRMAANALTTALNADPDHVESHLNLASLFLEVRQPAPARVHAERALALEPRRYECLLGMGLLCRAEDNFSDALRWLEQAESVAPGKKEAPTAIGVLHQEMGAPAAAIAAFDRGLRWHPDDPALRSNRLFTMNYLDEWNAAAWLAAHRQFERAIRVPRRRRISTRATKTDPRCRIGYVSGDLRSHAVARFLLPVLRNHDRDRFHVTAYYAGRIVDDTTRTIAGLCDTFRQVAGASDQQLLQQIADDEIDMLVDLSGHSSGNRLPVFAAGAAPVQLTWLGYLGSTGLSAMHYRITDGIADPPGISEAWHTEQLIRMPHCLWTYEPYAGAPAVTALPLLRNGYVTFGALNNAAKVTDLALQTWATILQRVPGSRLILTAGNDSAVRERFLKPFVDAGIAPARVTLSARLSTQAYLETWGEIDIALDAFPYSGGTTVCDALWQGVPVIALHSIRPFGGSAATVLHQVGMDDWVADTPAALVALASVKTVQEHNAQLDELRQTLRQRMQASPLLDAAGFARELEEALGTLHRDKH